MRFTAMVLPAFALLVAGGCSSSAPRIVSSDALGVTYRVAPDAQADAEAAASEYCQSRGRTARLQNVTPAGNNRSTMAFNCV